MKTDIEIAQEAELKPIKEIAAVLDLTEDDLEFYGKYKAKISDSYLKRIQDKEDGKLILVTAINPTPAGEGKTTTSVGLSQFQWRISIFILPVIFMPLHLPIICWLRFWIIIFSRAMHFALTVVRFYGKDVWI